jgi:hypothetical protein
LASEATFIARLSHERLSARKEPPSPLCSFSRSKSRSFETQWDPHTLKPCDSCLHEEIGQHLLFFSRGRSFQDTGHHLNAYAILGIRPLTPPNRVAISPSLLRDLYTALPFPTCRSESSMLIVQSLPICPCSILAAVIPTGKSPDGGIAAGPFRRLDVSC